MAYYSDVFNYKKAADTKIERFICGVYYVEIVETPKEFEAWLRHKDYGVSMLMFGGDKENLRKMIFGDFTAKCTAVDEARAIKRYFLATVENELPESIELYNHNYLDEEDIEA